jgi:hypothetical protein
MENVHGLTSMKNQSMGLLVLWRNFTIVDILNAKDFDASLKAQRNSEGFLVFKEKRSP